MKGLLIAALVALYLVPAVLGGCAAGWSSQDSSNLRIYRCVVDRIYEDGSAETVDAEDASECMRRAGVWDAFIADYR